MKNDLQILIEEIQREHDYLQDELNACIKEWDFVGAEAFRMPLIYTRQQLTTLKNLENHNFDSINDLKRMIAQINELQNKDDLSSFYKELMLGRISGYEVELKRLENEGPVFHMDNDILLTCLE